MINTKMKSEKGITMVSLVITTIVLILLANAIIYNARDGLRLGKLENMQNARLLNKIENLNETVHDLECQIRDLKNNRNVKIADFFTSYSNIQNRYDSNNVEYQMKHINDITKIFGVEMQQVKGFSDLTEEDQAIFSQGILEFLNGYGLGNRIQHLPVKVWKEANILKFLTLTGGDKEQWMDLKGNIL